MFNLFKKSLIFAILATFSINFNVFPTNGNQQFLEKKGFFIKNYRNTQNKPEQKVETFDKQEEELVNTLNNLSLNRYKLHNKKTKITKQTKTQTKNHLHKLTLQLSMKKNELLKKETILKAHQNLIKKHENKINLPKIITSSTCFSLSIKIPWQLIC